jgi:hypothetical protein
MTDKLTDVQYAILMSPARNEGETYEQFKAREKLIKKQLKKYLKL